MSADYAGAVWRKSSRSGSQGGNCVEVAMLDQHTAVRDSKNPQDGAIVLSAGAWLAFLDSVKNDEFDRPLPI